MSQFNFFSAIAAAISLAKLVLLWYINKLLLNNKVSQQVILTLLVLIVSYLCANFANGAGLHVYVLGDKSLQFFVFQLFYCQFLPLQKLSFY